MFMFLLLCKVTKIENNVLNIKCMEVYNNMSEHIQNKEDLFDISALDPRTKTAIVCMFFARLPSSDIRYKNNCYKVIAEIAEKYGFKKSLIKHDKDTFDGVFEKNGRQGWKDRPLARRGALFEEV